MEEKYSKAHTDQCHLDRNILNVLLRYSMCSSSWSWWWFFLLLEVWRNQEVRHKSNLSQMSLLKCAPWYPAWRKLFPFIFFWVHVMFFHFDSRLVSTPVLSLVYFSILFTHSLFFSGLVCLFKPCCVIYLIVALCLIHYNCKSLISCSLFFMSTCVLPPTVDFEDDY